MSFSRRATAVLAALALLPALVAVQAATTTQEATAATSLLRPADGVYRATIRRTEHGIPHITARDYGSLGFGHGFATAETSICSLADTLLTARGERSRYLGANRRYRDHVTLDATNRQTDTLFTDIRNRRVVERLLADPRRGPSQETKAIVRGYTAGINRYLRSVGGSPGIEDPACRGAAWIRPTATPLDLWYGVYAANLLASTGVFVPQIADAAPPTADDPGLPATGTASFAEVPRSLPSRDDLLAGLGKDPRAPFGSNATAVGADSTATGHGMLLGNPHFPWRGRYRFTQSHLTIPGEYDVAGASLIGSPVVNIGFNDDVAWSHTVSTAYRFTPYEYRTVPGAPTTYLTEEGPRDLRRREVSFQAKGRDGRLRTVTEDVYRTAQGYVLHAPDVLMPWSPASFFAIRDANAEHLRTIDTFHGMAKAHNVRQLLAAEDRGRRHALGEHDRRGPGGQRALRRPLRRTQRPRRGRRALPHPGRRGAVRAGRAARPRRHPRLRRLRLAHRRGREPSRRVRSGQPARDVSPGLGGQRQRQLLAAEPRAAARGLRPDHRLRALRAEPADPDGLPLRDGPARRARRAGRGPPGLPPHAAALRAREPGLRRRAGPSRRRPARGLPRGRRRPGVRRADHLGRSLRHRQRRHARLPGVLEARPRRAAVGGSVRPRRPGRHPARPEREEPAGGGRDARRAGLPAGEAGAVRRPLGLPPGGRRRRRPAIPVGGGEGFAGNANAVSSRFPATNRDRLYPVSYGSSHIQAVAFTDHGVDADTILTYGQSLDPTSRYSSDQTRLFGRERWVDFPWTDRQIRGDLVRSYRVSGRG